MHHSVWAYFQISLAPMVCHEWSNFNMTSRQLIVSACSPSFLQSLRSALSSLTFSIPEPRKCPWTSHTCPARPETSNPACLFSSAFSCAHLPQLISTAKFPCVVKAMKKARKKENSVLWCLAGGLWCLANRESCEPQRPANNFSTGSGLLTWAPGTGRSLMFSPTWL